MLCRLTSALRGGDVAHVLCGFRDARVQAASRAPATRTVSLHGGPRDHFLFLRLAGLLRRLRPCILHARNWGTWSDAALAVRLVPGVPLLLGFHGLETSGFSAAQRRRARWLGLSRHMAATVSCSARDLLVEQLGFDPDRVVVIPNGVDLERYRPADPPRRQAARAALGLPNDCFAVGLVANFFHAVKGHDLLIASFARLAALEPRARLVLIGVGPLEEAVRADIARRGLAERVVFAGRSENVAELLPGLDAGVCSSRSEGLSNAVLEALATALPCVVTDVSDHRRMFAEIDPELVVPVGATDLLADRLLALAGDSQRRQRVGLRARSLVERDYSFTHTVENYRRVYDLLLDKEAAAGQPRPGDLPAVTALARTPGG